MSAFTLLRELSLRRPGDLAYRGYAALLARTRIMRWRWPTVDPDPRDLVHALRAGFGATLEEFSRHVDARPAPRFFFDASTAHTWEAPPGPSDPVLHAADAVMSRRFSAGGSPEVTFRAEIDWHHALHTDLRWPRPYWANLPYKRLGDRGDIKACWEWNRHACFVTLGRAYRRTGDERYVAAFEDLLQSWIAQNPPERGVHWISNLEIGLRCVSWLWAHHMMAAARGYRPRSRARLHLHVFYMARHLARNLAYSVWTARNNHLIGDAACLAMVALLYPELRDAPAWRARALRQLWRAMDEQVLADGMHFEVSFGYHQLVLELVLQVVVLLKRNGEAVPARALRTVEAMLDVVLDARQPDGRLPNINDDDGGTALPLHDTPDERVAMLLAMGAVLFERGDFKAAAGRFPEGAWWLLGAAGAEAFAKLVERARPVRAVALPQSGLCIMRSGADDRAHFGMFDNHTDPFPDSGHGHASLLQLLLFVHGRPVLIDGGTYRYGGDGGFRNALRSTAAHNTVVVDGASQAVPARAFGWLSRLRPRGTTLATEPRYVLIDGAHDSYRRGANPVRHRRIVLWLQEPCLWLVHDRLEGRGHHLFQQYWHFPNEARLDRPEGDGLLVTFPDGLGVRVGFPQSAGDDIQMRRGAADAPWSWESRSYGELRPRLSVCRAWRADLSSGGSARTTLIVPGSVTAMGADRVEIGDGVISLLDGRVRLMVDGERARCVL